ncbi:MAG: hypothetical protein LBO21_07860, partial [Synergistaceae bacterium]|nr:hypothetical protein [Synergistaceae bacterium]
MDQSGEHFYRTLSSSLGSDKAASLALGEAGIPGLQYLDGTSRNKGEGTHNFVVWNEDTMEIMEMYYQAMNSDVDLDEIVPVYNVSAEQADNAKLSTWADVREHLNGLIGKEAMLSADAKAKLSIASKNKARHVTSSSWRGRSPEQTEARKAALLSVEGIVNHSVLIESWQDTDNDLVENMHRFYLPLRIRGKTYTVRLVAQEMRDNKGMIPIEADLFDLIVEDNQTPAENAASAKSSDPAATVGVDEITIRDMLSGVNDAEGNAYTQVGKKKPRGAINLSDPNNVKIIFTPRADVTTAIHEFGHLFLWITNRQAAEFADDAQLQADMNAIREFVGWTEGQNGFTDKQHDKFADAFLEYVREGRAPSAALRNAFRRFKKWLADFFRAIRGNPEVQLSDEMRGVFDRILATEEELEAQSGGTNRNGQNEERSAQGRLRENIVNDAGEYERRFGDDNVRALTSDTRREFEPEIPEQQEGGRLVTIAEIRAKVDDLVPWRHGKTVPGSIGTFYVFSEVMRSRYRNDLPVALHELGHYLDKKLGSGDLEESQKRELHDNLSEDFKKAYSEEQLQGEGFAQFFLHYMINDAQARAKYPEFYKVFEERLSQAEPGLRTAVADIKASVARYFTQTPQERLRANIVYDPDADAESKKLSETVYDLFVDSLAPLQRITNEVRDRLDVKYLEDDKNLYARARTAAGYRGKADRDIAPIMAVFGNLKPEEHALLSEFLAAARAQDYRANGMKPGLGISEEEERAIIAGTPEHIKTAAAEIREIYTDTVQRTLVETGIMSQEQFDYLKEKWPNYVPFFRVDNPGQAEMDIAAFLRGRGKSLVNLPNPIKRATGVSDEAEVYQILDPLLSMLRNMQAFHALAARNEVGKTMINISQVEGFGRYAEKVEGPGEKGDSVFYVWKDGEREYYATDPDVYAALSAINETSPTASGMRKLANVLTIPAEIFKMGTTRWNPAFIVRNFLRDTVNVAINSESWMPPLYNSIRGLMIRYSNDPRMKSILNEAIEEGVFRSGITEIRGNSPHALRREVRAAFREGGFTEKARQSIVALERWIGGWNEGIEIAPKLYEYYYLRGKGMPKQEAAMRAREVNIDFARAGTWGREVNRVTAFFNANIQGVDKAIRTSVERRGQTFGKVLLYVVLPSVTTWVLANLWGDDEDRKEYEEMPRRIKDLFWLFKVGDTWVRIPKPDTFGMAGSLAERVLDAAYKKEPAAFRGLPRSLWDAGVPPVIPTLLLPWIEAYANRSFFTGRPIVSQKYDRLPPELQYAAYTSGVSKLMGEYTGISPLKIDHVLRGIGGTLGSEALKATSGQLSSENREQISPSEWAFVRTLFMQPYASSESMDRFYELAEQTSRAKAGFDVKRKGGERAKPGRDEKFAKTFSTT